MIKYSLNNQIRSYLGKVKKGKKSMQNRILNGVPVFTVLTTRLYKTLDQVMVDNDPDGLLYGNYKMSKQNILICGIPVIALMREGNFL